MKPAATESSFRFFDRRYFFPALISLCALAATFLVSNSDFAYRVKLSVFVLIVFLYLLIYAVFYIFYILNTRQTGFEQTSAMCKSIFNDEIDAKLLALEEASRFFGTSLKSADMFRLVASRVAELLPSAVCMLLFPVEDKSKLKAVYAVGESSHNFTNLEIGFGQGLAGKTFEKGEGQIDNQLLDKYKISENSFDDLKSGIAVPLLQNGQVFGVLMLYGKTKNQFDRRSLELLEAVGTRVAPLFLSSRAFESSLTNALTDALTDLPNERAFYLVLENQIAEAQRFRDNRQLTILTIDIRNFGEVNGQYGHAAGDRILGYAAAAIKNQLRQMDFLARSTGDEFLAVLPTASDQITREIIGRVERAFVSQPFEISRQEKVHLQLNFGAASFGKDGETAAELLKHAILRRQQAKKTENNNILWFPKEYVN